MLGRVCPMRLNARLATLAAIGLLAPIASRWAIRAVPAAHRAELLVYDWHARSLPPLPPDDRIVVVGMDQESLAHLPLDRPFYPLPRTIHASVVRELHAAGASVIAFDTWFSRSLPAEDRDFAAALDAGRPVLTGTEPHVTIVDGEERVTVTPPTAALRPFVTACSILAPPILGKFRWIQPDVEDSASADRYTHLTVALAEAIGGHITGAPLGGTGELLIRFAGPPATFKPLPLYQVFDGSWRQRLGPDFFRGKAVLIGIIDPHVDRALTPVGDMQGVEVLAQTAQTIHQGLWIRPLSERQNAVLATVACLLMVAAIWRFGIRWGLLLFGLQGVAWFFAAHRLFVARQVWVNTIEPVAALALTLGVASVYEAGRVRRLFRRFLPSSVADAMLQTTATELPSAREIEATVVFCDVRSSTTLAEMLAAERMEALLRRYFTAGEDAARRFGTELDKFVGDEIMLYFEDRAGTEHHALRAVRWAFAIHEACEEITASGLAAPIGFHVGVGICSGIVRIGTVGARQRIQHTVMGDAVNTASRLQALTRDLRQSTLVSETTWQYVQDQVDGAPIGDVPIRGKAQPVKLYAPVRMK
jgi:adenylate cyclase